MNIDSQSQSELPETDSFVALLNTSNAGSLEGLRNPSAAVCNSDVIFSAHDSPEFGNEVGLLHGSGASEPDHGGSFQGLETFEKASSSVDTPATRADYNKALFEARMSTIGDAVIKMLWETGIMKQIFDSDDDSVFLQLCHRYLLNILRYHLERSTSRQGKALQQMCLRPKAW